MAQISRSLAPIPYFAPLPKNALHNARDISVCGLSLPTQSTSLISDQSWNAKRPKNATILQVSLIIALTLLQFMQNSHEFAAL